MKKLVEAQNVWDSPAQAAAMTLLAWYHSEHTDYASVSFGRIARWSGVERSYVIRLMQQLQLEKDACVNLGPDPQQGGRNRWKLTIEKAIVKARRQAGVGDDVPLARIERRRHRRRPSTVVIPGAPEKQRNEDAEAVENDLRSLSATPGITTPVIPGAPPGQPGITTLVIPGSPQSAPSSNEGKERSLSTAADAGASAASHSAEFQLIGEARTSLAEKAAHRAAAEHRARLGTRIKRHARWLLEHPGDAAALNAGAPIANESDLVHVTRERCRRKRIPGYNEGDVLVNVCRSEWHLFGIRGLLNAPRPRDRRTDTERTTTRGTPRKNWRPS